MAAPPAQTCSPSPPPASEHAQQESQPSGQQQPAALSARAQKLLNRLEKGGELGSMLRVAAWEKKWRKQAEAMLQAISNLPTAAELEQAKEADIGLLQAVLQHVDDEASRSNALAAMEGLRRTCNSSASAQTAHKRCGITLFHQRHRGNRIGGGNHRCGGLGV